MMRVLLLDREQITNGLFRLSLLAIVVGVVTGFGAVAFRAPARICPEAMAFADVAQPELLIDLLRSQIKTDQRPLHQVAP
jgi:hypothetical protein